MFYKEKIMIGTAHFGMPYGINQNKDNFTTKKEIKKILKIARNHKILKLDTASAYGIAEKNLGTCGIKDFQVISKIFIDENQHNLENYIYSQIENTLYNLKVGSLHGLLIHNPLSLLSNRGQHIFRYLLQAKEMYKIKKIGISAHHFFEIKPIVKEFNIDIIQLPFNFFDQRAIKDELFHLLKKNKIEIHVRSIFLQGLLLVPVNELPKNFLRWKQLFENLDTYVNNHNISRLEACISYVNSFKEIDKIIIGVQESKELENIMSLNIKNLPPFEGALSSDELLLIDPSKWKKN